MSAHSISGQDATRAKPAGWPKTPYQMLERIEKRWMELEAREVSNYDFRCLMSDVSQFVHDYRTFETDLLAALKFVDRLYSTIGGVVNPLGYGLIANSDECGAMINAVRDAINKSENGQ